MDLNTNIRRTSTTNLFLNIDEKTRHVLISAKCDIGVTDVFEFCMDEFIKNDPKYKVGIHEEKICDREDSGIKFCCNIL